MYKVILSEKVHSSIKSFIDWYRNIFLNLFSDTWIFDEELIREHYINSSKKFQIEIFKLIEETLKQKSILWRKNVWYNTFQIIMKLWNYKLFLYYSEDNEDLIRYIEDLKLHKK